MKTVNLRPGEQLRKGQLYSSELFSLWIHKGFSSSSSSDLTMEYPTIGMIKAGELFLFVETVLQAKMTTGTIQHWLRVIHGNIIGIVTTGLLPPHKLFKQAVEEE